MASIKLNYAYSVAYQILLIIVPVFTIPYISRIFGPQNLGVYSYTSSISQYFVLFAMLGLNNYGVRAIAIVRDDAESLSKTFSEIWLMQLGTSTMALMLYMCFTLLCGGLYKVYFIIQILFVASAIVDINWLFFGIEKFRLTVIRNSIIKILSLAAIFLFIRTKDDLWIYVLIHSVSVFISALALWPTALLNVHFVLPGIKDVLKHLKPNLIMFIPVVAISVYKYMDKIMLGAFSLQQTGYYENAEKILGVILGLVTALGTVMLPRISNLIANKKQDVAAKYLVTSMNFIMFLSIGIASVIYVASDSFVPIFFGEGFTPCARVMQILAISAIFSSWANVIRTQFLIPHHKDRIYVLSVILGALLNFVGNFLLIKKFGAIGASISTIMAEASVAIVQTLASIRHLPYLKMLVNAIVFTFIGAIIIAFTEIVKYKVNISGIAELISSVTVATLTYVGLCLAYNHWCVRILIKVTTKRKK